MESPEDRPHLEHGSGSAGDGQLDRNRLDSLRPVAPTEGRPSRLRGKPKLRSKRPGWRRIVARSLTFIVLLAIAYAVFIAVDVARISTKPFQLSGLSTDSSGRVNVLVLGVGDPGHAGELLSDTMMVISLDTRDNRIAQISVPRDLRVDIPGYGIGKINAADAEGGTSLSEQTVSNTLGIPINYYALTDFTGMSNLVDAVGGLNVDVTQALVDPEYPCANNQYAVCGVDIQPGMQHMDGARVLEYVRCRKGTCGNDFGRAARQQQVLNLIRQKVLTGSVILDPFKLTPIISAVRTGIQTDMSAVQLAEFAAYWQASEKNQPIEVVLSTSSGGYLEDAPGSSDLLPIGGSFTAIQNYVGNIFSNSSGN